MTSNAHFVVTFNPDRVLSRHSSYDAALEVWVSRGEKMTEAVRSTDDPRWKHAPKAYSPGPYGFDKATPTKAEVEKHVKKRGHSPAVDFGVCQSCGKRMWLSGLGIGAHRRACGKVKAALTYVSLRKDEREALLDLGRREGDADSAKDAIFAKLLEDERFAHLDADTISEYAWGAAKFCFPNDPNVRY